MLIDLIFKCWLSITSAPKDSHRAESRRSRFVTHLITTDRLSQCYFILGIFPVTLFYSQLERVSSSTIELKKFMSEDRELELSAVPEYTIIKYIRTTGAVGTRNFATASKSFIILFHMPSKRPIRYCWIVLCEDAYGRVCFAGTWLHGNTEIGRDEYIILWRKELDSRMSNLYTITC